MLTLQKNPNTNLLPVVYNQSFNLSKWKPLIFKPETLLISVRKATNKNVLQRAEFSSLGLVMPFQPSMWSDKMVETAWSEAIKMVEFKMKGKYASVCINKLKARLSKLFEKLNFNTHRKSLAMILTPESENIIYLSFFVRPTVFFSRTISWLDLSANIQREPDFYYLVFDKEYASLHDFSNKQLRKLYEIKNESNPDDEFKKVEAVVRFINNKNDKPVFITGIPNMAELFYNSVSNTDNYFPLMNQKALFSSETIPSHINEIVNNWSSWRSKFITCSVLLAQKRNELISHIEAVLQALRRGADGLLLIDKLLKHQLQKPTSVNEILNKSDELTSQIEKFLLRGNKLEITEPGLLKNFGGIVLRIQT